MSYMFLITHTHTYGVLIMYCMFNQLGNPLVDELLQVWNGITMYDVSRPIGQREFQLYAIIIRTIHDALGITHFCGML